MIKTLSAKFELITRSGQSPDLEQSFPHELNQEVYCFYEMLHKKESCKIKCIVFVPEH